MSMIRATPEQNAPVGYIGMRAPRVPADLVPADLLPEVSLRREAVARLRAHPNYLIGETWLECLDDDSKRDAHLFGLPSTPTEWAAAGFAREPSVEFVAGAADALEAWHAGKGPRFEGGCEVWP
jgi:hypothetical protein